MGGESSPPIFYLQMVVQERANRQSGTQEQD